MIQSTEDVIQLTNIRHQKQKDNVKNKFILFIYYVDSKEWSKWTYLKNRTDSQTSKTNVWASLVVQWLRICLPMQGSWVQPLVWEDPICHGATKPVCHNYWAWAVEPASHNYWACEPQLLKPARLEPVLHNKRSHRSEKPAHSKEE